MEVLTMGLIQKYKEMDNTIYNTISLIIFIIALCLIFYSYPASAFNITTDETTETSIVWNLSALPAGVNITAISFDGIALNGFIANPKQLVQNNLYAGETHLITVVDTDGTTSTAQAKTISKVQTESDKALGQFNLWILVFFALIFLVCAVLIGINLLAYISLLMSFLGILTSINNNFITGCIFVIMFCSSALVAYDW